MKNLLIILCLFQIGWLNGQIGGIDPDNFHSSELVASTDSCTEVFLLDPPQNAPMGIHVRGKDCWVIGHQGNIFDPPTSLALIDLSTPNFDIIYEINLASIIVAGLHVQEDTLWYIEEEASILYKLNAYTGEELGQDTIPETANNVWGITGDGNDLLINEYSATETSSYIYRYNPQSHLITDTIEVFAPGMLGITYHNDKIYGIEPFGEDSLLVIDPVTGAIEDKSPWCIPVAYGITYDEVSASFYGSSGAINDGTGDIYSVPANLVSSLQSTATNKIPLVLSPNPAKDFLRVNMPEAANYTLTIFDAQGRCINEINRFGNEHRLDIGKLSPGVYHLQISGNNGSAAETFIKR